MDRKRYIELSTISGLSLTKEEMKLNWHFCPEWDFMLLFQIKEHDEDHDGENCSCSKWTTAEIETLGKGE